MLGIIKKDLFMIKNNYKSILIAFVIFVFYSIQFDMVMSFFLSFMGLMICISTFSYDDYNNWHAYASTLPCGKKGVVKSKYITSIVVVALLAIVSFLLCVVIGKLKNNLNINDLFFSSVSEFFILIFIMSFLFPVMFKYCSEKWKIAISLIAFGLVLLIGFLVKNINIKVSNNLISIFNSYYIIIFLIFSIFFIIISYFISKKIYLNKEY